IVRTFMRRRRAIEQRRTICFETKTDFLEIRIDLGMIQPEPIAREVARLGSDDAQHATVVNRGPRWRRGWIERHDGQAFAAGRAEDQNLRGLHDAEDLLRVLGLGWVEENGERRLIWKDVNEIDPDE